MLPNGDHIRVVAQPLPDGGLRLFLEDRTEQLRLASARDTLLRVRAATFDNLFEAISVFASDGRLYLWNRRFLEDWELDEEWLATHPRVDELVPAMARKLVNPTAAAQIREMVRQTTNERQSANGRISMTDGRHFQFAAVPLPDGNALLTMVDVTDSSRIEAALRERAEALEAADRVKTDFVANVSYELRTPLTSIGGFAELLGGRLRRAAQREGPGLCRRDSRIGRAAVEADQRRPRPHHRRRRRARRSRRSGSTSAGWSRARSTRARRARPRKAQKLEAEVKPATGHVFGDARRLREAVEHVLQNAIAYTDRKGRITLTADGDKENAVISIRDNGTGIAAKDLPRVFNRFDRMLEAGVRGEAALGLGLPLTRQFIEAHGGTVDLQSKKGTRHHGHADDPARVEMILRRRGGDQRGRRGAGAGRARRRRHHTVGAARRREDRAGARLHRRARPFGRGAQSRASRSSSPMRSSIRRCGTWIFTGSKMPRRSRSSGSIPRRSAVLLIEWPERAANIRGPTRSGCRSSSAPNGDRILTARVPPAWEGRWPPQ